MRSQIHSSGVVLVVTWALGACSDPAVSSAPGAASSAAAPLAAPAVPTVVAAPIVSHAPGSVPSAAPPRRSTIEGASPPLDPPTFTRLPASPGKRSDVGGTADFTPAGQLLLTDTGVVHVIDPESGEGFSVRTGSPIVASAASGARLALLEATGRLTVWETTSGTLARTWKRPALTDADVPMVVLSRDGARVAVASTSIAVLDVATGASLLERTPDVPAFGLELSGAEVGYTVNNLVVHVAAVDGGAVLAEQGFETTATFAVAVSPDTRWGAGAAPAGHGLAVADLRAKGGVRQLVGDTTCDAHISPAFSADSRHVYARGGSKWIKGFETGTWRPYASYHARPDQEIVGHADDLSRVLVARAGEPPRVVVVSNQREISLREVPPTIESFGLSVSVLAEVVASPW
jgi:hypothetical protein